MNLKKSVLSLGLAIAVTLPSIASTVTKAPEPSNKTIQQIEKRISQLDIDYSLYTGTEIKVKFMINENDEIIILSTYNSELDQNIKSALNYKHISDSDLQTHKVYILPIKFAAKA